MKTLTKRGLQHLCTCLVLPCILLSRLTERISGQTTGLSGWTQLLSLIPGAAGVYLRAAFLRHAAIRCSQDISVGFGTVFSGSGVAIGPGAYIGIGCCIGEVDIGADVLIASHVSIMNGTRQHGTERLDIPMRDQPGKHVPVTIGRDTWIGEKAVIAANVGAHCIVGAGAVVLKDLPDYSVAVGSPARIIRDRRSANHRSPGKASVPAEASRQHAGTPRGPA